MPVVMPIRRYVSPPISPALPGTYRWQASYSGDTHNLSSGPTACTEAGESAAVTKALPALSTAASGAVTLGEALRDRARLSGGLHPTGTIEFRLYGPNDSSCKDQVGATLTTSVDGDGEYTSPPVVPAIPGSYRWVASYSGDTDNAAAEPTGCADPAEAAVVSQVVPTLATSASAAVTLGGSVHDTARLSGAANPTGTITFKLYGPNDSACTNQVGASASATVNGDGEYVSPAITPSTSGTYRWVASYSGDTDNVPVGPTRCEEPGESVVVQAPPPLVPGMTLVKTQRVAGSLAGYVRTPLTVTVGQQIAYEMLIANTGNVPLALSLSDPLCDIGTHWGPIGELEADNMLAPGGQAQYYCTHVVSAADGRALTNTATATGTPSSGTAVGPLSSSVVADVQAGEALAAKSCVSGTVTLGGAAGCTRKPFNAKLSAAGVSKVTFYLDGRRLRTMSATEARSGEFLIGVDPRKLPYGVHRLTAMVTFTCGNKQTARTLLFFHCRPPAVKPAFTG